MGSNGGLLGPVQPKPRLLHANNRNISQHTLLSHACASVKIHKSDSYTSHCTVRSTDVLVYKQNPTVWHFVADPTSILSTTAMILVLSSSRHLLYEVQDFHCRPDQSGWYLHIAETTSSPRNPHSIIKRRIWS